MQWAKGDSSQITHRGAGFLLNLGVNSLSPVLRYFCPTVFNRSMQQDRKKFFTIQQLQGKGSEDSYSPSEGVLLELGEEWGGLLDDFSESRRLGRRNQISPRKEHK
ncbi:hypothetical protein KIL84_011041 [Mauremys mutica]|uniref:Uncharacterized protein n=1 Tax=Mauremys mutica TaxID=74926 RepID=A0A9D3X8V2_9SAUR|nr:hypothetical protein KIL84_011041 [Mauremys mutica]